MSGRWRVFIVRALKGNSYAVDMVETGEKALVLSRHIRHDAMVLDVKLPGISGIDVCRELRRLGNLVPLTARQGLDLGAILHHSFQGDQPFLAGRRQHLREQFIEPFSFSTRKSANVW
jgi:DNA-binding response OmpR family regulator